MPDATGDEFSPANWRPGDFCILAPLVCSRGTDRSLYLHQFEKCAEAAEWKSGFKTVALPLCQAGSD
jgi:hypothetical protein